MAPSISPSSTSSTYGEGTVAAAMAGGVVLSRSDGVAESPSALPSPSFSRLGAPPPPSCGFGGVARALWSAARAARSCSSTIAEMNPIGSARSLPLHLPERILPIPAEESRAVPKGNRGEQDEPFLDGHGTWDGSLPRPGRREGASDRSDIPPSPHNNSFEIIPGSSRGHRRIFLRPPFFGPLRRGDEEVEKAVEDVSRFESAKHAFGPSTRTKRKRRAKARLRGAPGPGEAADGTSERNQEPAAEP
eukprot:scaffold139_cov325-Pavlova_lutheri.AAC.46